MKHLLSYIAAMCCLVWQVTAQHPYFYTIDDDAGLPSNEIFDLKQDTFGYIWIGCNAGLYRYDGFKFTRFKNAAQNAIAISNLQIRPDNSIYCQNFYGQLFRAHDDTLSLLADLKSKVNMHPDYTVDSVGNVWIGMPDGLLKIDQRGNRQLLFKGDLSLTELDMISEGVLFGLDNHKGALRISVPGSHAPEILQILPDTPIFKNFRATIRTDKGTQFALLSDNETDSHKIVQLKGDRLMQVASFNHGELGRFIYSLSIADDALWICTSDGAYQISGNGEINRHYFPGEKVSCIIADREGALWFGTLENGIHVIPSPWLKLLNTSSGQIEDNNITALNKTPAGTLLMGTYSGDIYSLAAEDLHATLLPRSPGELYRNVTSIIPYTEHILIAGRGALSVINTDKHKATQHPAPYIRDITRKKDTLFLASTSGISCIADIRQFVANKNYTPAMASSTSGKRICYDAENNIVWVSINEGLATLSNGELTMYTIDGKPAYCAALYADKHGIWAGTISDGIYNIDHGKIALHLDQSNGLKGDNIKCITSQGDTLYAVTDECINIRYPDGHFGYVKQSSGINPKEINALLIADDHIYAGTIRGLYVLQVPVSLSNEVRPNIRITSVYTNDKQWKSHEPVTLNHDNRDVLINFSSTALRSRGRFHYLYRVSGYEDKWTKLDGSTNSIRVSHLPPGQHIFEVKAMNEDGLESAATARIAINVRSPFWESPWFYFAVMVFVSLSTGMFFVLRIRTIRKKGEIQHKLINSQLTALKAQMNPHFMYNTLNSIQDLILQHDIRATNYYLSRYSSLMRMILETSANEETELSEEAEMLQLYLELEQLRLGQDFAFSITTADELKDLTIKIPSMIIQPFVENAIKHGLLHKKGEKRLDIKFEKKGNTLDCTITDNGVGRKRAMEIRMRSPHRHNSFATRATEKRLELLNINRVQKIQFDIIDLVSGGVAIGTKVHLSIPIDKQLEDKS